MYRRKFICVLMTFFITFMSVFHSHVVFADYQEDDRIFDFMTEFIKQRNLVNQVKVVYDEYIKNGITPDEAFRFATNQIGSLLTDTAALTNAVKNTWNSLTGTEKSNIVDAYNDISNSPDTVINIPIDAVINLNIPTFDTSYKSQVPSYNSSGIAVVDVVTFFENILENYVDPTDRLDVQIEPPYGYPSWSAAYCHLVSGSYLSQVDKSDIFTRFFYGYVYHTKPYTSAYIAPYDSKNNYFYLRLAAYDSALYRCIQEYTNLSGYNASVWFTYVVPSSMYYGSFPELPNTNIAESSFTYGGSYYVVPITSKYLNVNYQDIVNNYFTKNIYDNRVVNYYPYLPTAEPSSTMPSNSVWLDELKKILTGNDVTYINITINNNNYYGDDEPTDPTDPADPTDIDVPEGWFDSVLDSIKNGFEGLNTSFTEFFGFFNPASDDFFLKVAFIPREEFIKSEFERIRDSASNKIPVVSQIFDIGIQVNELLSHNYSGADPPTFNITLPELYGGGTYSVIDFSYFDDYRSYIHGFIIVISFYHFFRRLLRKLPKIILH